MINIQVNNNIFANLVVDILEDRFDIAFETKVI